MEGKREFEALRSHSLKQSSTAFVTGFIHNLIAPSRSGFASFASQSTRTRAHARTHTHTHTQEKRYIEREGERDRETERERCTSGYDRYHVAAQQSICASLGKVTSNLLQLSLRFRYNFAVENKEECIQEALQK